MPVHTTSGAAAPKKADGGPATRKYVDVTIRFDLSGGGEATRNRVEAAVAEIAERSVESFNHRGLAAKIDRAASRFAYGYGPWMHGEIS